MSLRALDRRPNSTGHDVYVEGQRVANRMLRQSDQRLCDLHASVPTYTIQPDILGPVIARAKRPAQLAPSPNLVKDHNAQ